MHNAAYRALGLPFVYVPFQVNEDGLAAALDGMRALHIRGLGVSMPFKLTVMPLLDELHPLAAKIGAVNTIVNEAGRLVGHNTDADGAVRALAEVTAVRDLRVLVIGAGGAARAVVHGLVEAGAAVHLVNRTASKAEALVAEVRRSRAGEPSVVELSAGGLEDLSRTERFGAVVNCSSATMSGYGEELPIPDGALRPGLIVMDIVYKPLETVLVRRARGRGAVTVQGGRMLLHQACRQFEIYTGRSAPFDAMATALEQAIGP